MNPSPLDLVRLRKLAESPAPFFPAAEWESFTPGQAGPAQASLPVGYELEGELLLPLAVGEPIYIRRIVRCGVRVAGIFVSSPVTAILPNRIITLNSVYEVKRIGDSRSSLSPSR
jgi:hypothetical protein